MRRGFAAKVASGLNLADASARPFALSPVRPFAVSSLLQISFEPLQNLRQV